MDIKLNTVKKWREHVFPVSYKRGENINYKIRDMQDNLFGKGEIIYMDKQKYFNLCDFYGMSDMRYVFGLKIIIIPFVKLFIGFEKIEDQIAYELEIKEF